MPRKKTRSKGSDGDGTPETSGTDSIKIPAEPTRPTRPPAPPTAVVDQMLSDEEIARKAYALWESRGRPLGSPEEDWYRALHELCASGSSNSQK
jgi:Protein of unknown function (DUF2934)